MNDEPPVIEITGLGKTYRVSPTVTSGMAGLGEQLRRRASRAGSIRPDAGVVVDDEEEDELEDDREPDAVEEPVTTTREVVALRDIDLRIDRGRTVGITGPVGSGKSTLLRIIGRVSPPSAGRVVVRGRVAPLLDLSSGFLTQSATGRQNAYLIARLFGVPRYVVDRQIDAIFAFAGLEAKIDHRAGRYSAGQYKRLGYAIALHLETDVLLADERLIRGDSEFEQSCRDRLLALREAGQTLLFVSRDAKSLRTTCDELIVLQQGRLAAHERAEDLLGNAAAAPVGPEPEARPQSDSESDDVLEPQALLELQLRGKSHEELAQIMDVDESHVPRRIHEAVLQLVPREGAVAPRVRRAILERLLSQGSDPEGAALSRELRANPDALAWATDVRGVLVGLAGDTGARIPELPELPELPEPEGPRPKLAAFELLDDIERGAGSDRGYSLLAAAQQAAAQRGSDAVTLRDVAEAAGMPIEAAKLRVGGIRAGTSEAAKVTDERWDMVSGKVAARLLGPDGASTTVIRRSDASTIELLMSTLSAHLGVRCWVVVATRSGSLLRFEQPEEWTASDPGWHRVTVDFPPDTLPDGTLTIRLKVRLRDERTTVTFHHDGVLEFEVVGDEADAPTTDEPGPDVAWTVNSAPD